MGQTFTLAQKEKDIFKINGDDDELFTISTTINFLEVD